MMAVLSLTHTWLTLLDRNQEVCCIFFDFKKAFDSVPHGSLVKKLELLCLPQFILSWLRSYLTKHKQRVVVNGSTSKSIPVVSGVAQGSVLGPLLFLIYVDSISQLRLSNNSKLIMYADDILLYKTILMLTDYTELQEDINHIFDWSTSNEMSFNISKCKQMLLSRKKNSVAPTSMLLNGCPLQIVRSYRYLGFLITSDLSWSDHIGFLCSKAKKMLGLLYRQFSNNSSSLTMKKLYLSLVRPLLEYGAEVWHPHLSKDIWALESVQKFALRVCSKGWTTDYQSLLDKFQLPSLENRRLFLSLCKFFKIIHKQIYFPPEIVPSYLPLCNLRHCNPNQLVIPFAHTNYLKYSFIFNITPIWNNLPAEAQICTNLTLFKRYILPLFL